MFIREDEKQDSTCVPWILLKEIIAACIALFMSTRLVLVAGCLMLKIACTF